MKKTIYLIAIVSVCFLASCTNSASTEVTNENDSTATMVGSTSNDSSDMITVPVADSMLNK